MGAGASCPAGKVNEGGLCYEPCPAGYYGIAETCWSSCPSGWHDSGAFCNKPHYYRGAGHLSKEACESSDDHGAKTNGCYQDTACFGRWYPFCDSTPVNYDHYGCEDCYATCPANLTGGPLDLFCDKTTRSRPAGTVPPGTASHIHTTFVVIGIVALIVVILFGILAVKEGPKAAKAAAV